MKSTHLWTTALAVIATAVVTTMLIRAVDQRRAAGAPGARSALTTGVTEDTIDPAAWGRRYPRQYEAYKRTVDVERTRFGGSEAVQKLELDPRLKRIFNGYAFSLDYREERGHAYMLSDTDSTRRVTDSKQFGGCLECHSSALAAYRKLGDGDVMAGFDRMNAMPWKEARTHVDHPVACVDCHEPETMALRVSRPAFLIALKAWKAADGQPDYDLKRDATRGEMRAFVCGQCHAEYYFWDKGRKFGHPWQRGLKLEGIEAHYDSLAFRDWVHPESGAPVLKAQHPEFEMWNQGIHARSGVVCADCHMPKSAEGTDAISDHHVRSPLLNISNACQGCHKYSEAELLTRAEAIQSRTRELLNRGEDALVQLIDAIQDGMKRGCTDDQLAGARAMQRKAQFRLDFVLAENSMGFHAPQEAARLLAEAIDYARQGQLLAVAAGR